VYEVKSAAESKYPWDYYKPVRKVSAEDAFGPDNASECVRRASILFKITPEG
jgi:branched-chain amino acid transport system substrate-binding protein